MRPPSSRLVALLWGALITIGLGTYSMAEDKRPSPMPYPPLPEAISSFGATVNGDYLYVFSGHIGRIPGNSIEGLSPHFTRINLVKPGSVQEELAMHQPSQSPGLVAWKDQIFRVGGLSFKNHVGEETAFNSLAEFSKYDPQTNTWADLAPLPIPRSSLDAAVVGDKLYVVGGWNLQAGNAQEAPWHEEALVFDLTKLDGQWTPIAKPPFVTRALAAAAHNNKLYVLGGMNKDNGISQKVHIFDPQTNAWTAGPDLPGSGGFAGFAISAFPVGDNLYFSGSEGVVYGLDAAATAWKPVERLLFPRSFHRLVAAGKDQLVAVAGVARGGGYLANIEVIGVGAAQAHKVAEWKVPFTGKVKQGQALVLNGSSLYAFGGNNSTAPHDFSKDAFVNEAFRFDLAARTVEQLPNLPQPTQNANAQLVGSRVDQSIYVFGGLAHPGEKFSSVDTVFQYRLRSKAWSEEVQHLPTARAMFSSAVYDGAIWTFAGSQVNTAQSGLAKETWLWKINAEEPATVVPNADIPVTRRSFGGAVLGDRYYAVGGLGADSKIVGPTNVFDFKTSQWTTAAAPQHPRVFPSLAAAGGKIYLSGGFASVDGHFQAAKSIEVYDPAANTWQTLFEEPPFRSTAMSMLEYQDRLLFYGIDQQEEGVAHFALLDPNPTTVGFGASSNTTEERPTSSDLLLRLTRMDKNKDGSLTKDEVGERFQPLIARIDENKDGTASKEEIAAFVRSQESRQGGGQGRPEGAGGGRQGGQGRGGFGGDPVQAATRIFDENDKNKDGKLTGDEIPARLQRNLERIDANKDGAIEKSELEADFKTSFSARGSRGPGGPAGANPPATPPAN
ncbi:MAG: kelch repeat-containing protein [Planctomycetota bacterium]